MNVEQKALGVSILLAIVVSVVLIVGIEYGEPFYLQTLGEIESDLVDPILTAGKLFEPPMKKKTWVSCYTIGYANTTESFYIRYEFTYPHDPHKLQYTKWQDISYQVLIDNWDTIVLFQPRFSRINKEVG